MQSTLQHTWSCKLGKQACRVGFLLKILLKLSKSSAASPRSTVKQGWESQCNITSEHPWRKVAGAGLAPSLEKSNSCCKRPRQGIHSPQAGLQAPPSGLRHQLVQFTLKLRQTYGKHLYNSSKYLDVRHCCLPSVYNTSYSSERNWWKDMFRNCGLLAQPSCLYLSVEK